MAHPPSEISFIILQFMYKYNMYESALNFEQETRIYFNMETFKGMLISGLWEKVHTYLRSFIDPCDIYNSWVIFLKIGRESYLEALDKKDFEKALSVFDKDLKPLPPASSNYTSQLLELIPLDNFRENREYAQYGDTEAMRAQLVVDVVEMLKQHPLINYRLYFPKIDDSRLETLLSQSAAANPAAMSSLFSDRFCERSTSLNPHQSVDAQLTRRTYRNGQNREAGTSSAPHPSYLDFNL